MGFDYFYEEEAEKFSFYRIPKILFTDLRFKELSTEGKVLYGLFLDRVSLSRDNGWIDENKRVYIIFTVEAIRDYLGCSEKSAIKYLAELDESGLIERKRQGLGKPTLIYVKNFSERQNVWGNATNNENMQSIKNTDTDLCNLQPNHTDYNNADITDTSPILPDDERMGYEKYIDRQLEIGILKQDYPCDGEMIDGIRELILDVLSSKRETIIIAGDEKPVSTVKSRFMKLNMEHIKYVTDCMRGNKTKIRSIKQYLLAALYNAPATMESYYQAAVSHDMAEGKFMKGEEKWI